MYCSEIFLFFLIYLLSLLWKVPSVVDFKEIYLNTPKMPSFYCGKLVCKHARLNITFTNIVTWLNYKYKHLRHAVLQANPWSEIFLIFCIERCRPWNANQTFEYIQISDNKKLRKTNSSIVDQSRNYRMCFTSQE